MTHITIQFLLDLGRTTLWLAAAAVASLVVLRLVRASSPAVHRIAWAMTLAVGWSFLRLSVSLPWYEAAPIETPVPASVVAETMEPRSGELATAELAWTEEPLPAPAAEMPLPVTHAERESAGWRLGWPPVVVGIWAAGIVVLIATWLVGYLRFVRRLPASQPAETAWQEQWHELLSASGVRRSIPLRITPDLGPMLCRLPRGYELIVPVGLWRELKANQRDAILRHELAHYQRGDVWKSLAVRVLALPHWFNPASWLAVRRFEEAAEWVCDRAATLDAPATEYAKALVRLGEVANRGAAYGPAAHGRTLTARIRRVLNPRREEDSTMKKTLFVAVGFCLVALPLVRLQLVAKEPLTGSSQPTAPGEQLQPKDRLNVPDYVQQPSSYAPSGQPLDTAGSPVYGGSSSASAQPPDAGPTVSPYLQVLQRDGALELSAPKVEPGAKPAVPSEAFQKVIDAARKAYEATLGSYEAETATLEAVCAWSQRWMNATMDATNDPKQKVAAAQAHLDRMRQRQNAVKLLYVIGSKGGEAEKMAAADFYVAQAERLLAEMGQEEPGKAAVAPIAPRRDESTASPDAPAASQRSQDAAPTRVTQSEVLDLKIKIAEIEGQFEQAESQSSGIARAMTDGNLSSEERGRLNTEQSKLKAQRKSLGKQLELYRQKLALYERAGSTSVPATRPSTVDIPASGQPEPKPEASAAPSVPASATGRTSRAADDRSLSYNGKDFRHWAGVLRSELSVENRTEAIRALKAFGVNGYGKEATAQIIEVMGAYTAWPTDNAPILLTKAAIDAITNLPTADTVPLLIELLSRTDGNQRQFALRAAWRTQAKELVPALLGIASKETDVQMRKFALQSVSRIDHAAPEFVAALRSALRDSEREIVVAAIQIIGGGEGDRYVERGETASFHLAKIPALAPELVELLAHDDSQIRDAADRALKGLGPDAVDALEKEASKSAQPEITAHVKQILEAIHRREAMRSGRAGST